MPIDIEALEREAAEEEAAAKNVALTDDEKRIAAAFEKKRKAREDRAAADRVRRENDLQSREADARKRAPKGVLVKGIDLVSLFPLGEAPDVSLMPGNGVIIVRDPIQGLGAFHREVEHKKKDVWEIYADLVCTPGTVLDPDIEKDPAEGAKLRAFCERYQGAATGMGNVVAKLGGARAQEDKRGRS